MNGAPKKKLSTNRSLLAFLIRGVCSLTILAFVDLFEIAMDLNTIAAPYDRKFSLFYVNGFFIAKRINRELERRGIDYCVKYHFFAIIGGLNFYLLHECMHAMNLLSADYNQNG